MWQAPACQIFVLWHVAAFLKPELLTNAFLSWSLGTRNVGKCRDTMKKRINQGYGRISPKNCFLDGQSTNCRVNANITGYKKDVVSLWLHSMDNNQDIETLETKLIDELKPEWNLIK